jgi:hypothetical protein
MHPSVALVASIRRGAHGVAAASTRSPPLKKLPDLLKRKRRRLPAWRRVLYFAGAGLAVAAGVFGWLVPVVTGIPFYGGGAVLLALARPAAVRWINGLERRLPERWRRRLRRAVRKVPSRRLRGAVNLPPAAKRA